MRAENAADDFNGNVGLFIHGLLKEKQKTPEICLEAVKQRGESLYYVPENLLTPEICLEAVKQNGFALYYVPTNLRSHELCMEAVKKNGLMLLRVHDEMKTHELCMEAVKQNGDALEYVPAQLRDSVEHDLEHAEDDVLPRVRG
jgi:Domain of unknown function (DUF4116)